MGSLFWKLIFSLGFEVFVGQSLDPDLYNVFQSYFHLNVLWNHLIVTNLE